MTGREPTASDVLDTTFVTGFPSFTARRMIEKLLGAAPRERVFMLVRHQEVGDADAFLAALPADRQKQLTVLVGNVTSMDLGLSGGEYRTLVEHVTCMHHMAARYHIGATKEVVEQYNVGGVRGALGLALECSQLRRFNFWSTVQVAGDREGVVMEDELVTGQRFHNCYEHSKYAAEKIVRQMGKRVPSTIFRPGIIVGDSVSGEIGPFDGPYNLIRVLMSGPFELQLPLPGRGTGPLHLVPIDFVIDAAYLLSRSDSAVSKTFHLVDPAPLSGRAVFQLVAERMDRKVRRATIPSPVARTILRLPWVGRLKGSPKTIMEGFNQHVCYNCRNTLEALRGTGVWCPPIDSYVDNLVRFLSGEQARYPHRHDDDLFDPLD